MDDAMRTLSSIDEIKRSILNYLKVTLIDRYLKKDGPHNSQNIVI